MSRESKQDLMSAVIYEARREEAANERFDSLAAQALGVNRTDMGALNIVENQGGTITAGQLAETMGVTTAAITAVLDRLESKGYARRVRDASDRRRVNVELTPFFLERARQIWEPLGSEARAMLERFSIADLNAVREWFTA